MATRCPIRRWYMTGMRRSALKETLLRALRTQMQTQTQMQPDDFNFDFNFNSFSIDPLVGQGQRWLRLTRSDPRLLEHIQIDATVFDGSAPATRSASLSNPRRRLHVTLAVEVSKYDSRSRPLVMQFLCSAWPDALDVDRVFAAPPGIHAINPYLGPRFKNLDEEMQKAVHDYLDERGINDDLAAFLHKYIPHKDRTEHIRWLRNIETYLNK